MVVIGVDTGGTFTDFIYRDRSGWGVFKRLSTPADPSEAVLDGLRQIGGVDPVSVVHGSTVATNAILEKKGARTALVANRRFEDVVEIGRQNRTRLYDLAYRKNPPLVPPELRFGISGRVGKDGSVVEPVDPAEIADVVARVRDAGAESVAVSLLFSFQHPDHETAVGAALAEIGVPFSLSHQILSEFREFERTSTTIINAYVSPKMERYLGHIDDAVGEGRLRIMQSNGGGISAATARRESVRTILSGPAGGAVGAFEIGRNAGYEHLITFDMGGTSTDVALLDGGLPLTLESAIDHYPVKVPMIDIHTVGAGGGSIAYLDAGGSLRVGPESAGADPGPICYGKGDRITVTDANLFLGRLIPERFLGGEMALDEEKLAAHFDEMAKRAGLSPVELAEGVLAVANTAMERAIRVISVERGFDPRNFALFAFGGAGGLHAVSLARMLNIPEVFIPRNPGVLSAIGMLMADVIKDYSQTVMAAAADRNALAESFRPMEDKARIEMVEEGVAAEAVLLERLLDMRYQGQSYEIIVPFGEDYIEDFHRLHETMHGYANRDNAVEVVNVRLRARGVPEKPAHVRSEPAGETPDPEALLGERRVVFDGHRFIARVVDRGKLRAGNRLRGPAILVEYTSTIVIPPKAGARVDEFENLLIRVNE
ncbi:MAG: hydantoinase/oxoprolinase family protein [Desulfococcaceae bacterium]